MTEFTKQQIEEIKAQVDGDLAKLNAGTHEVNAAGELVEK